MSWRNRVEGVYWIHLAHDKDHGGFYEHGNEPSAPLKAGGPSYQALTSR
jgi:hypothetical protein